MADIDIRRAHNLGLQAARAAADRMAEHLGRKFGLRGEWNGNTLDFERPGVSGSLAIDDKDLRLVVNLGLMLKMLRPSIEGAVHEQLDELFTQGGGPSPGGARSRKAAARPKKAG